MTTTTKSRARQTQGGIALLISIFILLLISVVAIALIVSSGTESALAGNYRSSTGVYYAAMSGLEEVRSRLWPKDPNAFSITDPGFLPSATPLPACSPVYVINHLDSETVTPWIAGSTYADNEFGPEFLTTGCSMPSSPPTARSIWRRSPLRNLSFPGPLYKWVRINGVTERSLNLDAYPYDGTINNGLVYYDGVRLNDQTNGSQVLELTALAVLPNGSQKLLQYLVASTTLNLVFPAAMTLDGYSDAYSGPNHNFFQISGNQDSGDSACGGPSMPYPVPAVGVPDNPDINYVINGNPGPGSTGIPGGQLGNYTGTGSTPSVVRVNLPPNLQTVQSLNQLVQTIVQNADTVIGGPADQTSIPSAMSSSNPMTVVIQGNPAIPSQGNLTLSGGFTGYGLLLVTGTFLYTPDLNWNGIILVIGQGNVGTTSGGGGGSVNGAILIAQIRDSSGNLLAGPNPGRATFNDATTSTVGRGYYYNCSWIQAAQPAAGYKVLSFHEIAQ
ncbi:MAG TPA: hypothetical protein VMH48_01335 [Methylomirabilota bacterium]|nr:hypothetical protein [Methylomirabilota bacterium]